MDRPGEWIRGQKHPNTPRTIFINVYEYDLIRRVFPSRCKICDYVLSRDEKAIRELAFICSDSTCDCKKMYGPISHRVCYLCYDMFYALYVNHGMTNMNYFKTIDEKEKKDFDDRRRRL
jgi:hypothetical protein